VLMWRSQSVFVGSGDLPAEPTLVTYELVGCDGTGGSLWVYRHAGTLTD
jgi:hypothetical protein